MVVLEVLFPYGFIYEIGPPKSQSCATPPLFTQAGGKGMTVGDRGDGKSLGIVSPLFSLLCSDIGWSLVATTLGDGKGVKSG